MFQKILIKPIFTDPTEFETPGVSGSYAEAQKISKLNEKKIPKPKVTKRKKTETMNLNFIKESGSLLSSSSLSLPLEPDSEIGTKSVNEKTESNIQINHDLRAIDEDIEIVELVDRRRADIKSKALYQFIKDCLFEFMTSNDYPKYLPQQKRQLNDLELIQKKGILVFLKKNNKLHELHNYELWDIFVHHNFLNVTSTSACKNFVNDLRKNLAREIGAIFSDDIQQDGKFVYHKLSLTLFC